MSRSSAIAVLATVTTASAAPAPDHTGYATVSATVWWARGPWASLAATSPGIRGLGGYRANAWVSWIGTVDIVFVEAMERADINYYSIGTGPRFHLRNGTPFEPYADMELSWHRFSLSGDDQSQLGLRADLGVAWMMRPEISVTAAIGYDAADFSSGGYAGGGPDSNFAVVVGELGLVTRW